MFNKTLSLALALAAGLASTPAAEAQWERAYGLKDTKDFGHRRVTPVTQCPGGGYISIGTWDQTGLSYVYVVRTDDFGGTIWEQYYDVGADGRADEGLALTELKHGGWVTTGMSNRGTRWDAHAMKLDCNGRPQITNFYALNTPSLQPYRLVGNDIRELYTGDGVTTNGLDLAIAGYLESVNGVKSDAILLRLDQNLNLIWHRRFDLGGAERFFGLTELRPTFAPTGDIAVVGEYDDTFGRRQALVGRIDGLNGVLGLSPDQCMALYGDSGSERFDSIVETQTWPDTGLLTMAGRSDSPGLANDVYVVQTKPNPCGMLAQVTLGNETGDPFEEYATDIIEVLNPLDPGLGVPVGSFALTGSAETKYSIADAFLLFVKPTNLHFLAARRYGDHGHYADFGTSLAQNSAFGPQFPGFVIAGTTGTDWDGSADPADLYLIQPNDAAKTGCEKEWYPYDIDWSWDPRPVDPTIVKFALQTAVHTRVGRADTVVPVCN